MNKKTESALEFNKIRTLLASCAGSPGGVRLCEELEPLSGLGEIRSALQNTTDAVSRILANGRLSFAANTDIGFAVSRLELEGSLSLSELFRLGGLLTLAETVKKYASPDKKQAVSDSLTPLFAAIEPCVSLKNEISRCILSESEVSDYASPALLKIRRAKKTSADRIHTTLNSLLNGSLRNCLQDNVITLRNGRYCVPVKSEYRSRVQGLIHDQSSSGSTLFIEPMSVVKLNNDIRQLELDEEAEIAVILAALSASASEKAEQIKNDIELLNELDFIFAKATLSLQMNAAEPVYNDRGIISLKKARHPLIEKHKVVPINVSIGEDYELLVITGPNTGGKTVTLKTVGLLSLMGQSGLHIPALSMSTLCVFDEVFADIGDEQSIEQSLSTFSSHMTHVIACLEKATEHSLVLLDELGSGTDPVEGAALAISILEEFHAIGARTIATTHYSELKVFALTSPGVENAGCEFDVETLRPTYRLITGTPGKSNAFEITRKLGMPERIIASASENIDYRDENFEDMLADLEARRKDLEQRLADAEKREAELLKREEALRSREERASSKRENQLENAKDEAAEIIREAKEYADDLIRRLRKAEKGRVDMKALERERTRAGERLKSAMQARSPVPEKALTGGLKPKDVKIGDEVKILSMDLKGTVTSLPDAKGNLFVNTGIIRTKTNIRDLILAEDKPDYAKHSEKGKGSGRLKYSKSMSVSGEINLLGKTVDEALALLDKYLDDASMAHFPEVRIIHGKGTGALRNGIHNYLRTWPNIEFSLAPFGEGDAGVTIVKFK